MDKYDKIQKRLSGQLSPAEEKDFDKQLESDADLRASFDFSKDLSDFFVEEQAGLEGKLNTLGDKYFNPQPPSTSTPRQSKLWLLLPLLLGGILLIWFLMPEQENTTPIEEEQKSNTTEISAEEETPIQSEEINPKKEEAPVSPIEENKPEFLQEEVKEDPGPIAGLNPEDFKINPSFEAILSEQVRAGFEIEVENPLSGTKLSAKEGSFLISGQTDVPPPYKVVIYSNREFDFDNDYAALRLDLRGEPEGSNYRFNLEAKTSFTPGLYYWILLDSEEELLHAAKFEVRE